MFNSLNLTDALGRPVESYLMDIKDRPITITNVEGQVMNFYYGVGGMVKSVERFDGTIVSNSYNSAALLEKSVFGNLTNSFSYYKNAMPALITGLALLTIQHQTHIITLLTMWEQFTLLQTRPEQSLKAIATHLTEKYNGLRNLNIF